MPGAVRRCGWHRRASVRSFCPMASPTAPCPACAAPIPHANNFCGVCGAPAREASETSAGGASAPSASAGTPTRAQEGSLAGDSPTAAGATTAHTAGAATSSDTPVRARRSWKGPRRTIITGALLLLVGGGVATLTASSIQSGVSGIAAEAGSSFIEGLLSSVGLTGVSVGSDGSGGTSLTLVVAFLVGSLVGLVGALILAVGVVWLLIRMFGGRGDGTFTTQPVAVPGTFTTRPNAARRPGTFTTQPTDPGPASPADPGRSSSSAVPGSSAGAGRQDGPSGSGNPGGPDRPSGSGDSAASAPAGVRGSGPGGALTPQEELRYQYERARPTIDAARDTYRADIAPRLEQGMVEGKKAAAAALAKAREARDRRAGR